MRIIYGLLTWNYFWIFGFECNVMIANILGQLLESVSQQNRISKQNNTKVNKGKRIFII